MTNDTRQQLYEYFDRRGVAYDKRWGVDKLSALMAQFEEDAATKIRNQQANKDKVKNMDDGLIAKTKVPVKHTQEQVEKAIAKELEVDGFMAKFTDDTWHFKCRGAEESGNLAIPLHVIQRKAQVVSKGARGIRAIRGDGTYGKSYNDTILMA